MANLTVQDIEQKFLRAHQAGDTAAARVLAAEVKRLRALPVVDASVPSFSDAARISVDSAGMGFADTGFGTNAPEETARQRKLTQDARDRAGWGGTAVDLATQYYMPTGVPLKMAKGLQVLGHGVSGGVTAAADAYGHGKDWSEIGESALIGTGAGAAISKLTEPIASWMSRRKQRAEALKAQPYKTEEDLAKAKSQKYADVDAEGVVYKANNLTRLAAELNQVDLVPGRDDAIIALRNRIMNQWKGKDMSPSELDAVRQQFRKELTATKREKDVAGQFIKGMDKYTEKAPLVKPRPKGQQGPEQAASDAAKTAQKAARDLAAREFRAQEFGARMAKAERNVTAGRNNPFSPSRESSTIKQASVLDEKIKTGKAKGKFTAEEEAAIEQLYKGTRFRKLAAAVEPYSFTGKEVGKWSRIAALPMTLPAEGLRFLGDRATAREVEDIGALIRNQQNYSKIAAKPAEVASKKETLARLMGGVVRQRNRGEQ
jgi:hypothetical protein